MRLVVDTGVFSAALSRGRRAQFENKLSLLPRNQLFLAAVSVAELRYGALVAAWGDARRRQLEHAISTATVVPVSDRLLTTVAELRHACRLAGHPLADRAHANDLWIAASALHIAAPLVTADHVFDATPGLELAGWPDHRLELSANRRRLGQRRHFGSLRATASRTRALNASSSTSSLELTRFGGQVGCVDHAA